MRPTVCNIIIRATIPILPRRSITTSLSPLSYLSSNKLQTDDGGSTSSNTAFTKPKVYNSNVTGSGSDPRSQLTIEQKKEVNEHNRHFAKIHRQKSLGLSDKFGREVLKGQLYGNLSRLAIGEHVKVMEAIHRWRQTFA
jgi:hypothetical protein